MDVVLTAEPLAEPCRGGGAPDDRRSGLGRVRFDQHADEHGFHGSGRLTPPSPGRLP